MDKNFQCATFRFDSLTWSLCSSKPESCLGGFGDILCDGIAGIEKSLMGVASLDEVEAVEDERCVGGP